MVDRNRWEPPDDLEFVPERLPPGFQAMQGEDEDADWAEAVQWVADRNADLQLRTCVRLEKIVRTLINGGGHLHGWQNATGGVAPPGTGLGPLEHLRGCRIDCSLRRYTVHNKQGEVHVSLATPPAGANLGHDAEGRTRKACTVGPEQSGRPPHVWLTCGPGWVRMQPYQREAELVNALLRLTNTGALLREWVVGGDEIAINSQTLMIYGPYNGEAVAAISAAQRHVQLPLGTPDDTSARVANLDRAEKVRILNQLAGSIGLQFYDPVARAVVTADGTVIEQL